MNLGLRPLIAPPGGKLIGNRSRDLSKALRRTATTLLKVMIDPATPLSTRARASEEYFSGRDPIGSRSAWATGNVSRLWVENHEAGNHEKAPHHAVTAQGHHTQVGEHGSEAAKAHRDEHGQKQFQRGEGWALPCPFSFILIEANDVECILVTQPPASAKI